MHKNNSFCRVCGYELGSPPWGEDGYSPSWEICSCCGTEFGYEDCTPMSARKKRQNWITNGMRWFDEKAKPENWSFDDQSINIPNEFI